MKTYINSYGYEICTKRDRQGCPIYKHKAISENMLGGQRIPDMEIHHLDGDKINNSESNLMICSLQYHRIMHQRMNAIKACGFSWWRKCRHCKNYDHPKNLYINGRFVRHRECARIFDRKRYKPIRRS